jgi:DNA topoisomerase-1
MNNNYDVMIVESPPKAKTIAKLFRNDPNYNIRVYATKGYVIDLPKDEYALSYEDAKVNVKWVYSEGSRKIISEIKKAVQNAREVYISTDDDREGEKIAKDIIEKLKLVNYKRVVFTSITKKKIIEGINNPRSIDENMTESSFTRRVIDREIGYPVSNIMKYDFTKNKIIVPPNIGCGRVISPALHILSLNQKSIDDFEVEEYKRIKVRYIKDGVSFHSIHDTRFKIESDANMLQLKLVKEQMMNNSHKVIRYTPKNREEKPPEALNTVTLQQSASNLYGFRGKYTMQLAQLLHENSFITYHRTDITTQSEETFQEILNYLNEHFNEDDILHTKRRFKKRKEHAQGAHEAIRPININDDFHPDNIISYWEKNDLFDKTKKDKYKFNIDHMLLYEIIWYRTLATQMVDAVYDASEAVIDIADNRLKLNANKIKTIKLYEGGEKTLYGWLLLKAELLRKSTLVNEDNEYYFDETVIPEFKEGEELEVVEITDIDGETRAPYHYGEGRFIKKLDSAGLVRPSTLATVLPSLEKKKYIRFEGKVIKITRLGQIVDEWVSEKAFWLNDLELAKSFQDSLDRISEGKPEDGDEELIMQYHERVEALKEEVGFIEYKDRTPEEWQIEKAMKIAKDNNIIISDEVLNSKENIENFIRNNTEKQEFESYGTCPACGKGKVKKNIKAYGCTNFKNGCKFTIWRNSIEKFFKIFCVQVTDAYVDNLIIAALKKKPLLYDGLVNKKGEKFKALIGIAYNENYNNWGLNLEPYKNTNTKKTIEYQEVKAKINYQNFKNEDQFKQKIERLFNMEGNTALCYAKIYIKDIKKINKQDIELLGKSLEFLTQENSILFLDDVLNIRILSIQGNSNAFLELVNNAIHTIKSHGNMQNRKIACGIEYKRFFNTIEELEQSVNNRVKESIYSSEFRICYGRTY